MPEPKQKILKVSLPAELYEQLEAAAEADDRALDRYVVRMVKQYLEGPKVETVRVVGIPGFPSAATPTVFPAEQVVPRNPTPPPGRVIPLATKGGGEGVPIDLLNDNSLNGEAEEVPNPNVSPVVVPRPNPNAPDMFGASHRK